MNSYYFADLVESNLNITSRYGSEAFGALLKDASLGFDFVCNAKATKRIGESSASGLREPGDGDDLEMAAYIAENLKRAARGAFSV